MHPEDIHLHRYYCNGAYGRAWGVRMVTGIGQDPETGHRMVIFKGVAGQCRRKAGSASREEFAAWAKYEVVLNENSWQRLAE